MQIAPSPLVMCAHAPTAGGRGGGALAVEGVRGGGGQDPAPVSQVRLVQCMSRLLGGILLEHAT